MIFIRLQFSNIRNYKKYCFIKSLKDWTYQTRDCRDSKFPLEEIRSIAQGAKSLNNSTGNS